MAKLTLQDIQSGFNTGPAINANNDLVEAAVENTLSRDGTSPNEMEANLDMGGFRVENLAAPINDNDAARRIDVQEGVVVNTDWDFLTNKPDTIDDVAALADPNADRILFWDDSAGQLTYLTPGTNLTITGTTLNATGGGSGGNITPDSHPDSPNAMDDEFEEASLNARWTWFNQGTATATFGRGALHLQTPVEVALNIRGIEQAHSGPARYRGKITGVNLNNFNMAGIYLRNTSNSRIVTFALHRVGGVYAVYNFLDANTFNSAPLSDTSRAAYAQPQNQGWLYGEVEDDGTNLILRLSHTGQDGMFDQALSVTRASFLGTPDRVGLYAFAENASTAGRLYCDWFRRMA